MNFGPVRLFSEPGRKVYNPGMLKQILQSPFAGAIGVVASWIWEAFWLIGPPVGLSQSNKKSYLCWGLVAMLVCGAQAFAAQASKISNLSRRLREIDEAKPRIRPKLPGAVGSIPVDHVFRNDRGEVVFSQTVPFLQIKFWNDPIHPYPRAVAKGVRAYVQFYHIGHEAAPVLTIPGRWSESTQPPGLPPLLEKEHLYETTFGFGQVRTVDIAFIDLSTGNCYAWNNDNYGHPRFANPRHLLQAASYVVHIRLRGEFVDETVRFTFNVRSNKFEFTQPTGTVQTQT